jgi:phage protein D
MFTLRLLDSGATTLENTLADDDLFTLGNEVEIEMGYMGETETVIVGEITGLEPEYCADEAQSLTVRGYDRGHRLMRGRKTRAFVEMSLKDIVGEIAGDVGLSPRVGDTNVVLKYVLQNNETDLEFLHARAARIGYEIFVTDQDLHFRAPDFGGGEELTFSPDQDLIEFRPRLSTMSQVDKVAVRGWNPAKKEEIVGKAKGASSTMGNTTGPNAAKQAFDSSETARTQSPVFSLEEAEEIAKGRFDEMALAYISGEGVCIGRSELRAGIVIRIEGLGQRFSGSYYVTSTTHSVTPNNGYRTAFTVRRNAT